MQGYNLEIRHIPGKRNPADMLSRQDKKDALGRKTVVHDANAELVRELHVPSDANDSAIQEALMRLFNAQVQEQFRDQSESDAVELDMCAERNGKKRERERNGKGTRSFLSRSSIFGHPFFSRFWPKS